MSLSVPEAAAGPRRWRPSLPTQARVRLVSGLVLFAFVTCHLLNHALGLVSLEVMERGRAVLLFPWKGPGEAVLVAALVVHMATSLAQLWRRRSLRIRPTEAAQLALGLGIPIWLTGHVLSTAGLETTHGVAADYAYIFDAIWPAGMLFQSLLLAVVWTHGVIGVHRWLRLKPWYGRLRSSATVVAFLVPALALAGTFTGAREWAAIKREDPAAAAVIAREGRWPSAEVKTAAVQRPADQIQIAFFSLLGVLLAGRVVRWGIERRRTLRLTYPGGRVVRVPRGVTVLEASRLRGIPHAAVCGGRGRCSTCRVRLGAGQEQVPSASVEERRVLDRIHALPDVRLACQVRPEHDLTVTPLMPAEAGLGQVMQGMDPSRGVEREIVVMFADLRAFTNLAQGRLPYDTVFVLNRYFAAMGATIEAAGGRVDKFLGDGIMAWFGLETEPEGAAAAAIRAARAMGEALDRLNRDLAVELEEPLRMGIGLHLGPAIVGEMGYGAATSLTAIGDAVNVASRLEATSKELAAEVVVSAEVLRTAGLPVATVDRRTIAVRGREGGLEVCVFSSAADLPHPSDPDPELARPGLEALRRRVPSLARSG